MHKKFNHWWILILCDQKQVSRLTIVVGEMVKRKTVAKSKFSQINDKIFYFTDAIVSLPFGDPNLNETEDFKQKLANKLKSTCGKKRSAFSI